MFSNLIFDVQTLPCRSPQCPPWQFNLVELRGTGDGYQFRFASPPLAILKDTGMVRSLFVFLSNDPHSH